MSVGANIKRMRRARSWTQGDLAKHSGLMLTSISKLERDTSDPKASTLRKLIAAFDCSPDNLLLDEDSNLNSKFKAVMEDVAALDDDMKEQIIRDVEDRVLASAVRAQFKDTDGFKMMLFKDKPKSVLGQ